MEEQKPVPPRQSIVSRLYGWGCRRLYHELAWSYDLVAWLVSAGQWSAWRRLVLDCLPAHGRVLEVGFGTGEILCELARRGYEVAGVDPSPAMQRLAAAKLRRSGLLSRAGRTRALAQRLPFGDGCFDAVVATFPAEYIFEPQAAAEFARVLAAPASPGPATGLRAGDRATVTQAGGRLVIVGVAVALTHPALARLLPVFYGWPPDGLLDRWQATLTAVGLQPRVLALPGRGSRILTVIAERMA